MPLTPNSAAAYARQLAQLLPPGRALDAEADSEITATLEAMAQELARVDSRGVDLMNEADPRTANETITDWEHTLSLPDAQVTAIPGTLAGRRIAVTQKYVSQGGQNVAFFVRLAAACGYTLVDVPVATPVAAIGFTFTTGGSLARPATYAYRVSAVDSLGRETVASPEVSHAFTGIGATCRVQITWALVTGALKYRVYGRVSGSEQLLATLGSTATGYTDDGSVSPSGALPAGTPPALVYPAIQKFAKSVLRAGFRCLDRVYGVDYAYSMLLNVQTPGGTALAQADFERVIRAHTHAHIKAVIFVYH